MTGVIVDNKVILEDEAEANQNYNKGYFGTLKNKKLYLHLLEATFLLETERITIQHGEKMFSFPELLDYGIDLFPKFEIEYLVFRDLRRRGYVVRIGEQHLFDMLPRGGAPFSHKPKYHVRAIPERSLFSIDDFATWITTSKHNKRGLILGLVDEEGDLTYYLTQLFKPKGKMMEDFVVSNKATLLGDRVMVWNERLSEELRRRYIGRNFGEDGAVQLSLLEAAYLIEKGLQVEKQHRVLTPKRFMKYAHKIQPDLQLRLQAYKDLRERGLIVKTGFKFGSHFRVYREAALEGHAPYLVHVLPKGYTSTWTELSRAVRLAHSVRKHMLFCYLGKENQYIRIRRITP
jgi:tRNA-intron endonuclease